MPILYAACAVLLTLAITMGVIYAVVTMVQIRKTARAAENFFVHAGATASVVSRYSEKASSLFGGFLPFLVGVSLAVKNRFSGRRDGGQEREAQVKAHS